MDRVQGVASAKLKLARIAEHLDVINSIIAKLAKSKDTYEIVEDADGKETIHFLVPPPSDIQIIAGEIIYQFRSILDHLAFDLVKSNPGKITLPKDWERDCQFPLLLSVPKRGNPPVPYPLPVPYEFFENKLPGISKAAYAFIESAQPYHRGPGFHNYLDVIGRLANIDKHRHLYVLLPRAAVRRTFEYPNMITGASQRGGLKQGAEIPLLPQVPPGDTPVNVKRSFIPYVTFDETVGRGPDTMTPANLLQECLEQFETVIIPAFEKLIQ